MGGRGQTLRVSACGTNEQTNKIIDLCLSCKLQKNTNQTDQVVDAATTLGQKLGGAAQIAARVQELPRAWPYWRSVRGHRKALLKSAMAFADAISSVSTLGGQFTI
jgi:hypothetical protein